MCDKMLVRDKIDSITSGERRNSIEMEISLKTV